MDQTKTCANCDKQQMCHLDKDIWDLKNTPCFQTALNGPDTFLHLKRFVANNCRFYQRAEDEGWQEKSRAGA